MDVFGIAQSGLQAASAQLAVTADNIANAESSGFKAGQVDLVELSGGGVGIGGVSRDDSAGTPEPDGDEGSNVDLTRESIHLVQAKVQYNANAAVISVADRMFGSLLDIMDDGSQRHRRA